MSLAVAEVCVVVLVMLLDPAVCELATSLVVAEICVVVVVVEELENDTVIAGAVVAGSDVEVLVN